MQKRNLLGATALLAIVLAAPAQATIFDRDMERARAMSVDGQTFETALAREYRDFFLFEADQMYDWFDADHFAEKALAANGGQRVAPEEIGNWNIDGEEFRAELASARAKLTAALDLGAAEAAPQEAAIAQARFDCWVEQQEEGWQWDHIKACKTQFEQAMVDLDAALNPPAPPPTPTAAAPEPTFVPVTEQVQVYFDFDEAAITPEARAEIDLFVNSIEDKSKVEIVVTGHTDRAGPEDYNRALSERRAEAVRATLVEEGLSISSLEELNLEAKGESQPAVETADGVPEPANRRVVLQGYGLQAATQTSQLGN